MSETVAPADARRARLERIGLEVLELHGVAAVLSGYGLTVADPVEVGRQAILWGDANADGTLN